MTLKQVYRKMQTVYDQMEKLGRMAVHIDRKSNNDLFTSYDIKGIDIIQILDSINFLCEMVEDIDVKRS